MKLAIMQPYFMPYLGYFQLMNAVDQFVVYDNIQYIKKSWINRNRFLLNGNENMFSIPLEKGSDYLNVNERMLSPGAAKQISRILEQIRQSYLKAPYFKDAFSLAENVFLYADTNLFNYIFNSINAVKEYLDIKTPLVVSSQISIDHSLKGKHKVISICHEMKADMYINPIGGMELYDKEEFEQNNIFLRFHRMNGIVYNQRNSGFTSSLSVIDVLMYNSKEQTKELLTQYELI